MERHRDIPLVDVLVSFCRRVRLRDDCDPASHLVNYSKDGLEPDCCPIALFRIAIILRRYKAKANGRSNHPSSLPLFSTQDSGVSGCIILPIMTLCVYLRGSSYWRSLRPLRLADEGTLFRKVSGSLSCCMNAQDTWWWLMRY
jgi:hypothetical protein